MLCCAVLYCNHPHPLSSSPHLLLILVPPLSFPLIFSSSFASNIPIPIPIQGISQFYHLNSNQIKSNPIYSFDSYFRFHPRRFFTHSSFDPSTQPSIHSSNFLSSSPPYSYPIHKAPPSLHQPRRTINKGNTSNK